MNNKHNDSPETKHILAIREEYLGVFCQFFQFKQFPQLLNLLFQYFGVHALPASV